LPLKDWDIDIFRGVLTGYNEAFIINGAEKNRLIKADPKSAEIIRPILRGRDIKRYKCEFADVWLIYVPWHFPLHKDNTITGVSEEAEAAFKASYPAIYNHLSKYKTELSNRNKAETGIRYEWYALQRWGANYSDDFSKQKIVWIELTDHANFCLDSEGYFVNNTVFFLTGDRLPYMLSFLNSKLCEWYFAKIAATSGVGTRRWIKQYIDQICIPHSISKKDEELLSGLALKIQKEKRLGLDVSALENQIDEIIFGLFDLSADEVDCVCQFDLATV
jgi:hypothetical protein